MNLVSLSKSKLIFRIIRPMVSCIVLVLAPFFIYHLDSDFYIFFMVAFNVIALFYIIKRNRLYIYEMNIIDTNIIKINYSYYAGDKEINLDLINTKIYKIALPSRAFFPNFALELQFEDFKIRQYPNYWFDGSAWKQDIIDDVYDKLIELQKQAKQI